MKKHTTRLAILAVVFLSNNSAVLPPQIIDNTVVTDNSIVDIDSETRIFKLKNPFWNQNKIKKYKIGIFPCLVNVL